MEPGGGNKVESHRQNHAVKWKNNIREESRRLREKEVQGKQEKEQWVEKEENKRKRTQRSTQRGEYMKTQIKESERKKKRKDIYYN